MDMFKMAKEAMAMRSKLAEMEKNLKSQIVEVETSSVRVKANGKGEFTEIKLLPELTGASVEKIERSVLSAVQQASKKAQELMAQEGKKITGGMKIPGLM